MKNIKLKHVGQQVIIYSANQAKRGRIETVISDNTSTMPDNVIGYVVSAGQERITSGPYNVYDLSEWELLYHRMIDDGNYLHDAAAQLHLVQTGEHP